MIGCECESCTSADVRNSRYRCSALVRSENASDTHILIDCPPEFRLQALRSRIARIDAVLLTHSHADHIFGLDDLRRYNHSQGTSIPILGNAETIRDVRRAFDYVFVDTQLGGGKPQLTLADVGNRVCVSIGGLWVYPLQADHGDLRVLGYRFAEAPGDTNTPPAPHELTGGVAYVTDCNHIPDATLASLQSLDVLILGALRYRPHATHFTIEQAVRLAQEVRAKSTFFTHIAHDLMHERDDALLPLGVHLGYDGLTVRTNWSCTR